MTLVSSPMNKNVKYFFFRLDIFFKKRLLSHDVINRCLLHGSFLRRAYLKQSHNIKTVFYMLPTLPEIKKRSQDASV